MFHKVLTVYFVGILKFWMSLPKDKQFYGTQRLIVKGKTDKKKTFNLNNHFGHFLISNKTAVFVSPVYLYCLLISSQMHIFKI